MAIPALVGVVGRYVLTSFVRRYVRNQVLSEIQDFIKTGLPSKALLEEFEAISGNTNITGEQLLAIKSGDITTLSEVLETLREEGTLIQSLPYKIPVPIYSEADLDKMFNNPRIDTLSAYLSYEMNRFKLISEITGNDTTSGILDRKGNTLKVVSYPASFTSVAQFEALINKADFLRLQQIDYDPKELVINSWTPSISEKRVYQISDWDKGMLSKNLANMTVLGDVKSLSGVNVSKGMSGSNVKMTSLSEIESGIVSINRGYELSNSVTYIKSSSITAMLLLMTLFKGAYSARPF